MESKDRQHSWVWDLKPGDKVWVATEESVASSDRFAVEFLEQTSPCEFEQMEEIFVPYEMEVKDNWILNGNQGESHIVSFEFTTPKMFRRLKFAVQMRERDLLNLFGRDRSDLVIAPRVFKNKHECREFCRQAIVTHYTTGMCDDLISALNKMIERVKGVRSICWAEENNIVDQDFAKDVEKILD